MNHPSHRFPDSFLWGAATSAYQVEGSTLADGRSHLKAIRAAMQQGVDLRGDFAWSLRDNLEWSLGFSKRFGIVHVDFATQGRTLKDSARFYAEVIASGGEALALDDAA